MAPINNSFQIKQGTLNVGSNVLITCPRTYQGSVQFLFTNTVSYDITVTVTRVATSNSIQLYNLSLDADDTVMVSDLLLFPGDSIDIGTSVANTVYQMFYTNTPFVKYP